MSMRILSLVCLLAVVAPAGAQVVIIDQPQDAYEVLAKTVQLPKRLDRQLTVYSCEGCSGTSVKLTEQTRFLLDGQSVGLDAFRDHARDHREDLMIIVYDRKSRQAVQMLMSAGGGVEKAAPRPRKAGQPDTLEQDQHAEKLRSSR